MKGDVIIVGGMLLTVAVDVFACARLRLVVPKFGFVVSAVAMCIGLANFGWRLLFGGVHTPDVSARIVVIDR
jgi:hypothetical protein